MVYDLWCMVYGLWSMVYGLWSMDYGLWSMVYGLWSMVYGLWSMVYGLWTMVYGLWSMVTRPAVDTIIRRIRRRGVVHQRLPVHIFFATIRVRVGVVGHAETL